MAKFPVRHDRLDVKSLSHIPIVRENPQSRILNELYSDIVVTNINTIKCDIRTGESTRRNTNYK